MGRLCQISCFSWVFFRFNIAKFVKPSMTPTIKFIVDYENNGHFTVRRPVSPIIKDFWGILTFGGRVALILRGQKLLCDWSISPIAECVYVTRIFIGQISSSRTCEIFILLFVNLSCHLCGFNIKNHKDKTCNWSNIFNYWQKMLLSEIPN